MSQSVDYIRHDVYRLPYAGIDEPVTDVSTQLTEGGEAITLNMCELVKRISTLNFQAFYLRKERETRDQISYVKRLTKYLVS